MHKAPGSAAVSAVSRIYEFRARAHALALAHELLLLRAGLGAPPPGCADVVQRARRNAAFAVIADKLRAPFLTARQLDNRAVCECVVLTELEILARLAQPLVL